MGSAIVNLIARNLGSRDAMARAVARYVRAMKKQTLPQGPARRPLKNP